MKFTKLTLVAMLLALLVCAFAACGGDTQTDAGTDADSGNETEATPGTDNNETEHEHTIVEKIEEPTCQTRGYKREVCSVCEQQISVKPIDMIDHVAAAPATCTEASVCKFCGVEIAKATGHTLGTVTDSKEATLTEAGYEKGTCSACGVEINNVIPAGIVFTFDDLEDGALNKEAFAALTGFEVLVRSADKESHMVVTEGDNKYVKKAADTSATITFKDLGNTLGAGKFAFSMDIRLDGKTANSGLISIKDAVGDGTEHRIISIWQGEKLRLGKNGGPNFLEIGEDWFNVRVVVDPSTYDYEIHIDGEKVLYTTYDESVDTKHLLWTLEGGEWTSAPLAERHISENVIPSDPSVGVSCIYLFHWSGTPLSYDNMRLEFLSVE